MSRQALIDHLRANALRTDGPFTLRSGEITEWYLDARQTTFDGVGSILVGHAFFEVLKPAARAIGGMTMGADPIALATALIASMEGRPLDAFSIRKEVKTHGIEGRLVGPVTPGTKVAIVEDTTTTGSAVLEAVSAAADAGLEVVQGISLVDRSGGMADSGFADRGIPYMALVTPADLGVGS